MIVNLVWDLDGTLFDTYPAFRQAFVAALDDFGLAADPEWIMRLAKISLSHCATVLAETHHLAQDEMSAAFAHHYEAIPYEAQPPMPGAEELCNYVVSNGRLNVIVTHRRRKSTLGLLETHGLEGFIADYITSDDGYPRKPDPSGVEAIMARNGMAKAETLLVGDRALDVEAGVAAGIRTCLLGQEECQLRPDYLAGDLYELARIMRDENPSRTSGAST